MRIARWAVGVWFLGCSGAPTLKGDEQMGQYQFTAQATGNGCNFDEVPGSFEFTAYFSHNKDGGRAWVTIGGIAHDATFDGQRIEAAYGAPRNFAKCSCGEGFTTTMTEHIVATIVSKSQSDAMGGCNTSPVVDLDAGITPPGSTPAGFDAVSACGVLEEWIAISPEPAEFTDGGCERQCLGCGLSYTIAGDRK